ncbi:hypothetical protein BDA96_10G259800, partial [Sorghum bicolor]
IVSLATNSAFPDVASSFRNQLQTRFFIVAIILMCWSIWTPKNDLIFNGDQPTVHNCRRKFFSEISLVQHRVKQSLQTSFNSWISTISPDVQLVFWSFSLFPSLFPSVI